MKPFRADLHCHSLFSDGSKSPKELILLAKEIGLSGLSITDHDSIGAYNEAIPAAKEAGILLGSGAEFSSEDRRKSVHILAYDFDLKNPQLHALCHRHILRRKDRNQRMIEKLAARGMPIDIEELEKRLEEGYPIGRPHIALALVEKGYVQSVQEAFQRLIGDGLPCFDSGKPISTDETIEIIHQAGGKAFIAHPHLMEDKNHLLQLLNKPFDGIECYYARFLPEREKKWIKIAEERKLLISGGSDFHGDIRPEIPLGSSWVDQPTFEKIFQRKL